MTYHVAGIGEILWDRFPDGDRLGGAPANFAFHAGQLGATSRIISRIGRDADGDRLAGLLEERDLSGDYLQRDPVYPTGIVRVELNQGQPSYVIESPVAWDYLELTDELKSFASRLDAICFGTLAQRNAASRGTIQEIIRLTSPNTLRVFDINLRQDFYTREIVEFGLSQASVVKCNDEEVSRLAELCGWQRRTEVVVSEIFKHYPVQWIAITKGAEGCEIHARDKMVRAVAPTVNCVDAVGAGDAFSAALVMGLLANRPLDEIAHHANQVGAYVASQPGAMPRLPLEYQQS